MADDALQQAQAELDRLTGEMHGLIDDVRGDAAGGGLAKRDSPEAARTRMLQAQERLQAKQQEIERAEQQVKAELDRQQQELRDLMHRQREAIGQALAPIQKTVARMQEAVDSIGLYLGIGEQIVTIRDGQPADRLEPIVIRQMVLAMDEESGVLAEAEGITAERVEEFDQWLLADEAHVDQIVPERKGIVALVPRFRPRRRSDPFRDDEDRLAHLLIRNGQALHRISVAFEVGDVLIPRADEFIAYFRRHRYNPSTGENDITPLQPGTPEYQQAIEAADARSRHYLRIGLILQGLIDRTEVLHPLHPAGINMLTDPSERSEKVRIIIDAEGGLPSGQQTFREWQQQMNGQLRVGMRIVGAFQGPDFQDADEHYDEQALRYGHSRLRPAANRYSQGRPASGVPHVIEQQADDGGLIIRFQRGEIYDREMWRENPDRPGWGWKGGERPAKRRGSCILYRSDRFILPYDLVDADTLEGFLADRRNRREYQTLWPLLREVMHAKRAEEQAEAPFREMLAGVIARENKVSVTEAEEQIPDLVRWWKLSNRHHRPLTLEDLGEEKDHATPGGRRRSAAPSRRQVAEAAERKQAHESKAVRMIVAEHHRRIRDQKRTVNEQVVDRLAAAHPGLLVIAQPRRGGYLVLEPAEADRDIFVHIHSYTAGGQLRENRQWQLVGSRAERWKIIRQSDRWAGWVRLARLAEHLTGPDRETLVGRARTMLEDRGLLMAITQETHDGPLYCWMITQQCVFDPARPLTGESHKPDQDCFVLAWQRKSGGHLHLGIKDIRGYVTGKGRIPWLDHDGKRSRLATLTLYEDAQAIDAWQAQHSLQADAERFAAPLRELRRLIIENLQHAWGQRETDRARERFLASGGRPQDWPARRQNLRLDWPYYEQPRYALVWHDAKEPWKQAISLAIEHDHIVDGQPLDELFTIAIAQHELRGAWVPTGENSKRWDEQALPELPEDLAGLQISLTPPAEQPQDQPEAEQGAGEVEAEQDATDDEGEVDRLADTIRRRVSDALAPEPEPEQPVAEIDGIEIYDPKADDDGR